VFESRRARQSGQNSRISHLLQRRTSGLNYPRDRRTSSECLLATLASLRRQTMAVCDAWGRSATFDWPVAIRRDHSRHFLGCRLKPIGHWTATVVRRLQHFSSGRNASFVNIDVPANCFGWTYSLTSSRSIHGHCARRRVTVASALSCQRGQRSGGRFGLPVGRQSTNSCEFIIGRGTAGTLNRYRRHKRSRCPTISALD